MIVADNTVTQYCSFHFNMNVYVMNSIIVISGLTKPDALLVSATLYILTVKFPLKYVEVLDLQSKLSNFAPLNHQQKKTIFV